MSEKQTSRLSDACIRASWEANRDAMQRFLLVEKKFNPKSIKKCIDNFIESMVFARIPSTTERGIHAAWETYKDE